MDTRALLWLRFSRKGREVIACTVFAALLLNVLFKILKSEVTANRIVRTIQILVLSVPERFTVEFRTFALIAVHVAHWRIGSAMATSGCSPS
jgi:general stress protein CsbA